MTHMERKLSYVVLGEDCVLVARCLDVEVGGDGPTEQEAVANLKEALELYFDGHSISPVRAKPLSPRGSWTCCAARCCGTTRWRLSAKTTGSR